MEKKPSLDDFTSFADELNKVSPSFCLAKWKQLTLHLQNGQNHSCHHPYPHKVDLQEISNDPSALHNTSFKKEQRRLMLEGKRPKECQYCWNVENTEAHKDKKIFSDRILKSSEGWAKDDLAKISSTPWNTNVNPSYLEVSFSNICNFKCSYCSPVYSSKWQEEAGKFGPYPTSSHYNDLSYFQANSEISDFSKKNNPYLDAFWKWWPSLSQDLKVFRITGGEPLLSPDTFKILDYLDSAPMPNLDLAINTNACVPSEIFEKFSTKIHSLLSRKKIKSFKLYASLDGTGAAAEYSRFGLDYSLWLKNTGYFLDHVENAALTVMCTTNIFSLTTFHSLINLIYEMKLKNPQNQIGIDSSILRFPHHLNLTILSSELKTSFDSSLSFMQTNRSSNTSQGFSDLEINRLKRLIEYVKSGPSNEDNLNVNTARSDFYSFVNEHDLRRGTHFLKTFPQLQAFYSECKKAHE